MQFNLDHATDILSRTPMILKSMLGNLPDEWTFSNEGDQTWSPFDVLGHLIHGELTDWVPRIRVILEAGESKPFEPFDRFAQKEASKGKSVEGLLATFEELRSNNIEALKKMNITEEDLKTRGQHPELGVVTLEELIATWVVHDLDHLVQVSRTMAKQYKEAVGPWQAYLSVLK
ncbi:MAG TPA: DinB family protein [Blastocatellia bacterium]|nr:DinB family protein [Blastocatellia bacterium]